ncbi:unnamed protein product [Clonostachys byssicola]|uniref:Uncharacterized protein n=1 Tax=Clonostachys byssicola TaxID=160290 RepID=A0A9N9TZF1_9HYPO|nr:unnamed protein product [Clonostachys byssicola]
MVVGAYTAPDASIPTPERQPMLHGDGNVKKKLEENETVCPKERHIAWHAAATQQQINARLLSTDSAPDLALGMWHIDKDISRGRVSASASVASNSVATSRTSQAQEGTWGTIARRINTMPPLHGSLIFCRALLIDRRVPSPDHLSLNLA